MVQHTRAAEESSVVDAAGLVKVFSDFWMRSKARAVDGIDFQIHRHELFGLLGPNGSGKSTTIKLILGLLRKSQGRLLVFGKDPGDVAVKRRIGYLPEESYMYRFLSARETLDYYGKLFGLDRRVRYRRIDELLAMVGLDKVGPRQVGEYSKGMARRLGLAQALINDPDFLILDEPTSGLDPIGTRQVKDLLLELKRRGKTILLSSHLLADVEDVCDRMVILYGGRIRAEGTATELLADSRRTIIETPRLDEKTIRRIDELLRTEAGVSIERVDAPRQRLEAFFLDLVERAVAEQTDTSGARTGGQTAAFLKEEREGDVLVAELTREETPVVRPAVIASDAVPQNPSADGPDLGVIDALLKDDHRGKGPTA
ncbi:MAG: ABC transporter ATP-binding protein [Planctomycetota bacterium]|nr:ABC transporter ATP-binding protein [Planctomycetota bacterium]